MPRPEPAAWSLRGGALAGSVVGGIAGSGAGVILLSVVAWTLGVRAAAPVLTITVPLGSPSRIRRSRHEIHRVPI